MIIVTIILKLGLSYPCSTFIFFKRYKNICEIENINVCVTFISLLTVIIYSTIKMKIIFINFLLTSYINFLRKLFLFSIHIKFTFLYGKCLLLLLSTVLLFLQSIFDPTTKVQCNFTHGKGLTLVARQTFPFQYKVAIMRLQICWHNWLLPQ